MESNNIYRTIKFGAWGLQAFYSESCTLTMVNIWLYALIIKRQAFLFIRQVWIDMYVAKSQE